MVTAISVEVFSGVLQTEQKLSENGESNRSGDEHQIEWNVSQTIWSSIPSRLDGGSNLQNPISSTLRCSGCEKHKDDSTSSFFSSKMCK